MQWGQLASAVVARRVELGFERREDLAEASGIGARTLGDIERAEEKGYRKSLLARLEQSLAWPPGTAQGILDGAEPPTPGSRTAYGTATANVGPPDGSPHPALLELAQLLNSPLPADIRTALLADVDRAMVAARREARGLPAHHHGGDAVTYATGGKVYIEAKNYASPTADIPKYLANLAAADSPLDPSDRDAIRDGMTSLARLGYSLLIVTRSGTGAAEADGTTDPRRADLTHPTGVSRIDR